tara:strand:- start:1144 stop:1359 length:216 start_codon:yes stop_codon:yes gene_type:complete
MEKVNRNTILICTNCKKSKILNFKDHLKCSNCDFFYPKYEGVPVMLNDKNDFYHLRKALLPAKYRVNKYGD